MKGLVKHHSDSWLDSGPFTNVHPVQPVNYVQQVNLTFGKSRGRVIRSNYLLKIESDHELLIAVPYYAVFILVFLSM
ncbi:MAG: hypothetical protein JNL29_13270 [Nitrospira sp.]|nr:hypothetical protein [Nitrospira sp.]